MKELHRILMVGDEPDIQAVVRVSLEAVGSFTVIRTSTGSARSPSLRSDDAGVFSPVPLGAGTCRNPRMRSRISSLS